MAVTRTGSLASTTLKGEDLHHLPEWERVPFARPFLMVGFLPEERA